MGLDMHLYKRHYINSGDVQIGAQDARLTEDGTIDPTKVRYVTEEIMYWRKFNALHNWFVKHVQDGVDDCRFSRVSTKCLTDLLTLLKRVCQYGRHGDLQKVQDIFPTARGFFFGSMDYDEWYWRDVHETIAFLEKELERPNPTWAEYEYRSSW